MLSIGALIFFSCKKSEEENNTEPTCSITSPTSGSEIEQGETVTISVEVEDEDENLKEVRFYVDGSGIGSAGSFPYSYDLETNGISEGNHTIKAKAIDDKQASSEDEIQMSIVGSLVAAFSADQTTITPDGSVKFTDESTNDPTSWSWDFGDGNTSSEQNPSHTYSSEGTYTVELIVSNDYGADTLTKTDYITVESTLTACDWNNETTFTDSRDGQEYKQIKIGDQCWMAENLNYDQSSYGNDWCYDNNSSHCNTYGRLYDWAAVMQGESSSSSNPSGVKGVCPDGWHVPSDEEWEELEMQLGMSQSEADKIGIRGTNEGSKLAGNASLWEDGDLENNSEFGTSGFTALPGGFRSSKDNLLGVGTSGGWWSSTERSSASAWRRYLYYGLSSVYRKDYDKDYGVLVRCVRD